MSEPSDDLRSRVAALEAENAALRAGEHPPGRRRRRSRTVLATVMIVLGVLLAPVAVVTGWAQWTLTDTDRFVATYAPLADDPAVQDYVVDQTMTLIDQKVDFDRLTADLVDGLVSLGTGPRATSALRTLQGSVADGLRSQVRDGVTAFVSSEKFATAWSDALRVGHQQFAATMQNDPSALATISADGSLGIPLDPIVERIKDDLVARGVTLAERIPSVNRSIVLVQSDVLPQVQIAYAATVALGTWLPWIVLALLIGGVAVANRRHRALLAAAAGFAGTMLVLALAIAAGRVAVVAAVPANVLPGSVSTLFYDAVTASMQSTAVAAAVLGVAVAVVGWLAGPFRAPTRLRGLYLDGVQQLRATAEQRGVTTGRFGDWVHRRRTLLLALIAVVAGVVLVAGMPVSVSLVGWTALWSTLAVVVLTVVERPTASVSA
ncbi:MAG TPA: hypothetical protein VFU98_16935 [Microlunatus sp.]|nr:hypothetical protein [Microlunatus sp.]